MILHDMIWYSWFMKTNLICDGRIAQTCPNLHFFPTLKVWSPHPSYPCTCAFVVTVRRHLLNACLCAASVRLVWFPPKEKEHVNLKISFLDVSWALMALMVNITIDTTSGSFSHFFTSFQSVSLRDGGAKQLGVRSFLPRRWRLHSPTSLWGPEGHPAAASLRPSANVWHIRVSFFVSMVSLKPP